MRLRRGSRAAAALIVGLAAATAACSSSSGPDAAPPSAAGDSPESTAAALVAGLASGELSALTFRDSTADAVAKDYAEVVEGMGDLTPSITLGGVTTDGDAAATATLHWSWPLTATNADPGADPGAGDWTYDAPVQLARLQGTWQVTWGHQDVEPSLNASSVLATTPVAARRGEILGGNGRAIVQDRAVTEVGIDRGRVRASRAAGAARALARLVDIDPGSYVKQVTGSGPRAFVLAITYRSGEVPRSVLSGYDRVEGAELLAAQEPLAPTRGFAAPILGTVGPVTAEMIEDHPDTYAVGDVAGLSGLQARYDQQLQGTPGVVVNAVGSDGKERPLFRVRARSGMPLHLTLDEGLETEAERLLADVRPASAVVAIRPSTGAVLAAANGPGNEGQNLATYGRYAPGSTFKSVSSLALLRAGLTPSTPVSCTPTVTVDGRVFENYDDYPSSALGRIPLRTAVADSCNTAFIGERSELRGSDLGDAAATLGLGVDHEVGFPAYYGSVTRAAGQTEAAADMIGQGTVLASPMAMAGVIASIEDGSTVVPHLVEGVEGLDVDPPADVDPLTRTEDDQLVSMLRGVVTDGSGALLADVPGPPVIAKTGTAEFEARDGTTRTHAGMIAAQGDLAVAVFVDEGPSGSGTAGPILEAFLRAARSGR